MWPSLGGRRFAVQIFGREPEVLARAAAMAAEVGASIVDINMGCPAKKVTAGLCGSALMREPELAVALVRAVRGALPSSIPSPSSTARAGTTAASTPPSSPAAWSTPAPP
jgi:tRNA-dihydrouridine synthase